jgi:putative methyltransferase
MSKKVVFLELTVFPNILPLASGYMEAYARKDPALAEAYSFEKISLPVATPEDEVFALLQRADAEVYGFSCYVWNTALMRRLLKRMLADKPGATFILGGPQVMNQGKSYLSPEHENVLICNGEGERTFSHFLRVLLTPERDFASVKSLSFYRAGELVTTEAEARIQDLSEVPSPFLEGVFEKGKYSWMVIETNRGCPFKCNYCYWGAAIGAKVFKYDNARIEQELSWITRSGCMYLFIADANWGMLPRDLELSEYLAREQKVNGSPMAVYFCGSKNTPERVTEITRVLHDAGMLASQSVALQTMSPEALKLVNRDNIKTSSYTELQRSLNRQGISSLVEMIWPLPGETLASFQAGLAQLCELEADSFQVYPLLLMNNVELNQKREEYGLVTMKETDANSEAEIVIETKQVNAEAYGEGVRYVYAVCSLHTQRGLWALGRYLSKNGVARYEDLFKSFVNFTKRFPQTAHSRFVEDSVKHNDFVRFDNLGALLYTNLHTDRESFDELIENFCRTQSFWADPKARFLFEIDLLNRPYVYLGRVAPKKHKFEQLRVLSTSTEGYLVEIPEEHMELLREYVTVQTLPGSKNRLEVNHKRVQQPTMKNRILREHHSYCEDMSQRMPSLMPLWRDPMAAKSRRLPVAPRA